jgi:hypothetical protein
MRGGISQVCMLLGVAVLGLANSTAGAQSFEETLNLVLTGSARDGMGLVEIENASDCVVRLLSQKGDHFALLRLNNVDPKTMRVAGRRGNRYVSFSGPDVIVELHSASGLTAVSQQVQITARNPDRERRNFNRLYTEFCSGSQGSGEAGS